MKTMNFKTICRKLYKSILSTLVLMITDFIPLMVILLLSCLAICSPEELTQTLTRCNPEVIQNYLTLQQAITPFRSLLVTWLVLNTFISVYQIWKPIKRTLWKIRLIIPMLWAALKQKLMI